MAITRKANYLWLMLCNVIILGILEGVNVNVCQNFNLVSRWHLPIKVFKESCQIFNLISKEGQTTPRSFSGVNLGYSVSLPMLGRDKKSLPHAELFLSFQLGKTACLYPSTAIPKVSWCATTVLFDVSKLSLAFVWNVLNLSYNTRRNTCKCQNVICCGMSKFRR